METDAHMEDTPVVACIEETSYKESDSSHQNSAMQDVDQNSTLSPTKITPKKVVRVLKKTHTDKTTARQPRDSQRSGDSSINDQKDSPKANEESSLHSKDRKSTISTEKVENDSKVSSEPQKDIIKEETKEPISEKYLTLQFSQNLLDSLKNLNSTLDKKYHQVHEIKEHLVTLENNINKQVEEFLKEMISTNKSLEQMFLDSLRETKPESFIDNLCLKLHKSYLFENNQKINLTFYRELKVIKDYINRLKLGENSFQTKQIVQFLGIGSLQEILKDFSPLEKNLIKNLTDTERKPSCEGLNFKDEKIPPKTLSYEDDQFTKSLQRRFKSPIKQSSKKRFPRDRIHSSSVFEKRLRPKALEFQNGCNFGKKFKESEDQSIDSANTFTAFRQKGGSIDKPVLPFVSDVKIDSETITQMLIDRLSKNNGLEQLNILGKILPDIISDKPRSYSQQL
ncbi:unnamed protein product [Moneuplotes crassus]|uniref:Uncharacterized protein n=1 Tax=Euplotes crassus TaxID=5936 RepID=A0AAD1U6H7_EUPCR|nr:unnamed protein product [Moneuplotes crassus]